MADAGPGKALPIRIICVGLRNLDGGRERERELSVGYIKTKSCSTLAILHPSLASSYSN